jgi:hypothetical protein
MPLHDYYCRACGRLFADVAVPIAVGAAAGAPVCRDCEQATEWIPQVGRMDAYEPFQAFSTYDGQNRPVVVDSLTKLRRIERESEQQARNGEGQPMVWRRYAQDASNRDVPTLGPLEGPAARPDPAVARRVGKVVRSAEEPDHAYGPGVSDANTSALKGGD